MKGSLFLSLICCLCIGLRAHGQDRAIDSLQTVLAHAIEDTNKVKTLHALTVSYRNSKLLDDARRTGEETLALADRLQFTDGKVRMLELLGSLELNTGNPEKALRHFQDALAIYERLHKKNAMASICINLGHTYFAWGKYQDAMKQYSAALALYEGMGDKVGLLSANNNIGRIHGTLGNYPEALKYFLDVLALARSLDRKHMIGNALGNIAKVYMYNEDFPLALQYNTESLQVMEELKNKEGIAGAYHDRAVIFEKQGDHEEALKLLHKALTLYEELQNKGMIAYMHNQLGAVYTSQENYTEALRSHKHALALRKEIGNPVEIAESYVYIGSCLAWEAPSMDSVRAMQNYHDAIKSILEGLALLKGTGYKQTEIGAYMRLSKIYTALRDYKNALEYQDLYVTLKDSLMNNETTRKIEQQRTQYEVEKAITEQKVQQEQLLANQRFESERALTERNAAHQLALAEEQARKEKAIEIERLKYAFALEEERIGQERALSEQKYLSEKAIAEESAQHELAMAEERARQEQEKADRRHKTGILLSLVTLLALIALFVYALIRQRNQKRVALERALTRNKMTELELQSLRAQLNPHFMFNSLNAIQELILREDNDMSHTYLARFAKLLRMLLENANSPFIPLAMEIEFLELYLSLEKLRIPDLQYQMQIDSTIDTEQLQIPNMILQPYIENAIWHGLSHKKSGERSIVIRATAQSKGVQYEIEDNGVGRKKAAELKSLYRKEHKSKGMELLTKRFKLLHEEYRYLVETQITDLLRDEQAGGTLVALRVPWEISQQVSKAAS